MSGHAPVAKAWMVFWALAAFAALAFMERSHAGEIEIPEQSARYRIALEREASAQFGLDAPVARMAAQIHQESRWNPSAQSPFARGLSQFTASTATWLPGVCPDVGAPDPWNADWSIRAIACYDRYLYVHLDGASECERWAFTLSAYNGGMGMLNRERMRASATGADAARWFNSVERFSARSRSAYVENRSYVRRILLDIEPAYLDAGWPGEAVCP